VGVNFIKPEELKARLDAGKAPLIIDLRFAWEHDLCHIPGDKLIDPENLVEFAAGLETGKEIVLYCKNQGKSTAAFRKLKDIEYTNISVLKGGMDAWAERIEKGTIRY
jgi:adenylyltransferase/sulfurtransferase